MPWGLVERFVLAVFTEKFGVGKFGGYAGKSFLVGKFLSSVEWYLGIQEKRVMYL